MSPLDIHFQAFSQMLSSWSPATLPPEDDGKEDQVNAYLEQLFKDEVVYVGTAQVTLDDVYDEVECELNRVSALVLRGKFDEANILNNEILEAHAKPLIINAMDSDRENSLIDQAA